MAGLSVDGGGDHSVPSYAASKAAVIHLMRHLATELGSRHILCNSIAPGFFPSRMANGVIEVMGGLDQMAKGTPSGRIGRPGDLAGTLVFLCSRAGSHITADVIELDGGKIWNRSAL